ncbi:hypothetical protein JCM8547_004046 [Rhodosporidiobolus lusitaniae]
MPTPSPQSSPSSSLLHLLPSLVPSSSSNSLTSRAKRNKRPSSAASSSLTTATAALAESPHPAGAQMLGSANAIQILQNAPGAKTVVDRRKPRRIGTVEAWWIWYRGTFVSSMLETWEFILIHTLLLALLVSLYFALSYLPQHVALVTRRVKYYVSGLDVLPEL